MPIHLAIIDDAEVVVRGLVEMLRPHAGEVEVRHLDSRQLTDGIGPGVDVDIDVALVDTALPGRADGTVLERIAAHPRVRRVAVFSWNLDRALVDEAFRCGATAFLSKTTGAGDLLAALHRVHAGERVVDTGLDGAGSADGTNGVDGAGTAGVVGRSNGVDHSPGTPDATAAASWPGREEGLTAREAEVIALITQGLSNQEIADHASLSINSVKSYIRTSYRKMGVTSRTNAVLWGLDHGFSPERRGASRGEDVVDS